MINLKEYIVTLMAMFLSLGIGILVGTSITDSVVVEQQKNMIEELENRYYQALDDMEELARDLGDRESLLSLYDRAAQELLPRESLEGLVDREVAVISLDYGRGMEVCDLLVQYGMRINPHIYLSRPGDEEGEVEGYLEDILSLTESLLSPAEVGDGSVGAGDGGGAGDLYREPVAAFYERPLNPEVFLLVLGGVSLEDGADDFLEGIFTILAPKKVVILEDYFLQGTGIAAVAGEGSRVIDYIDTGPGRAALLALLTGREVRPLKPGGPEDD